MHKSVKEMFINDYGTDYKSYMKHRQDIFEVIEMVIADMNNRHPEFIEYAMNEKYKDFVSVKDMFLKTQMNLN